MRRVTSEARMRGDADDISAKKERYLGLRFRGYSNNAACSSRYLNCNNSVGNTNSNYGCSAQSRAFEMDAEFWMSSLALENQNIMRQGI